jgi:hypothetical protein
MSAARRPAGFRKSPRRATSAAPRRFATAYAPLPGAVIDAVLRFHDRSEDQGAGRSLLSLSAIRLGDHEVAAALGDLSDRAGRVGILWNERESQIIRVMETPA